MSVGAPPRRTDAGGGQGMVLACDTCGGQWGFAEHILESVPYSVIVTAPDGTIRYWNRGAEALFGRSAGEVLGQNILTVTPNEAVIELAADIMAQLQAGATWSGEFPLRRRDGTRFRARVTDAPITGPDGTLLGIVGITLALPDRGREPLGSQQEAVNGQAWVAVADTTRYLRAQAPVPDREAIWPDLTEPLTTRELRVLELLARRYPNKEIATMLCLSWQTVAKHTANIFQKLRVAGRREAVERAAALGILPVRFPADASP
jgi:PAS domain S-box-containing protein